ncbi:MAG: hypothetical protein HW387_477 [Parachlamydiales bacterium]|nr:hypothetical protein [Parachlamydiales bacterium]
MATAKEIKKHMNIALKKVGEIKPWFDKKFNAWIFSHKNYPDVEYAGESPEEVIKNYPLYLHDFIEERLNNNLATHIEKATRGHGGKRPHAGRPNGTKKESKKRVYLPKDVAEWINRPNSIPQVRQLIAKGKH